MSAELFERVRAAETAAEQELDQIPEWVWDRESLPVPVEVIADSHYGLLVEEQSDLAAALTEPAGGNLSGLLVPSAKQVWVNAGEAPVRRRFSIGHELGHWVLHCGSGRETGPQVVHCRSSEVREEAAADADQATRYLGYPPRELEANQFAAAVLARPPDRHVRWRGRGRGVVRELHERGGRGLARRPGQ
jgi:IrrE N-terminal-like domain